MDLLYKNLVLIRNAISAMVFVGKSHEKEEPAQERIDVALEKYSPLSVKYFWRIRRAE